MKKQRSGGLLLRGLAVGLAVLAGVTVAHAAPYASALQVNGTNVTFIINEGGASVTITYGDGTTNASFNGVTTGTNLPAGPYTFGVPGTNTSYQISCYKVGTGVPFQYSTNAGTWPGGWPVTIRGVAVNACATNGQSFGRVYVADTGSSATRQYGIYGITPDLQSNSFFGGNNTNAIVTSTAASGPFAPAIASGNGGFGSGPYRLYVANDGGVYATDAEDAGANAYYFGNNFQVTNSVFSITGRVAGQNANQHGNINDIAIQGSFAAGNLQVWTADNGLFVPAYFANTNNFPGAASPNGPYGLGVGGIGTQGFGAQETEIGDANEIFRYDIGSGSYPATNTPDFAATTMLGGGFEDSQVCGIALDPTSTNYVYAMARRDNGSDGNIQIFSQATGARVYTSLHGNVNGAFNTAAGYYDIFATSGTIGGTALGAYGGVRISPDGRYMGVFEDTMIFVVCNLTNGIPDESSVQLLSNTDSQGTTGRQFGWDAADNLYAADSDLSVIHVWDLGNTATCVTANDLTGNHGTFQIILPPAATVANNGNASQNYGSPALAPGNFSVNLGTTILTNSVAIAFTISGTGTNLVNYNIGVGTNGSGVIVTTNAATLTVTFPVGTAPGGSNWNIQLPVTATASPAVGPTLTVTLTAKPSAAYIVGSPAAATVSIANTGPQYLFVSAASPVTSMIRGINNDYATFVVNRWGDTNGPSNSVASVVPSSYTITNFTLTNGSALNAVLGTDYTAGPQKLVAGQAPIDGLPGVQINPGDVSIKCLVGNPVPHTNVFVHTLTNNTIPVNIPVPGTANNGTTYSGTGTALATPLVEIDNRISAEVVLWSDPLTNSAASNYNVTFAATNLNNGSNSLPVLLTGYTYTNGGANSGSAANFGSVSNDFDVELGFPIANESSFEANAGVGFFGPTYSPPPSAVMTANGWSNVLRMTVNKTGSPTICGVNVFPTTNQFTGNYALRFDMYLSVWSGALNNPAPLNFPRQFAAFGVNTQGTNDDWRMSLSQATPLTNGCNPTNADGMWFAIDAGDGSLTPADYDAFVSPPVPNQGTSDLASGTGSLEAGVFKKPPFAVTDGDVDGAPINQWVSVSVETQSQTNLVVYMDGQPVMGSGSPSGTPIAFTNFATSFPSSWSGGSNVNNGSGVWTNGVPMLGYLQPYAVAGQSDESAFVYYSNLRVVEISPYITIHPLSAFGLAGFTNTITLTSAATYAQPGVTNIWYTGNNSGALVTPLATNVTAGTNLSSSLTLSNVFGAGQGTNYYSVYSDAAGSVTSFVSQVAIVGTPANQSGVAGSKVTFTVPAWPSTGNFTYQWQTNGVNLANGSKYTNVTTVSLGVSNVTSSDTIPSYDCLVTYIATNLNGAATNGVYSNLYVNLVTNTVTTAPATLSLTVGPSGAVVSPATQTNVWGSSATFTVSASGSTPFTYGWSRGVTNLVGPTKYSGTNAATLTISNLTTADSGTYTAHVTNSAGSTTAAGVLVVSVPAPTFGTATSVNGGANVLFNFTSPNTHDTTNSWILQSTTALTSPGTNAVWTNTTGAFTTSGPGVFSVTATNNGSAAMFYQLKHVTP